MHDTASFLSSNFILNIFNKNALNFWGKDLSKTVYNFSLTFYYKASSSSSSSSFFFFFFFFVFFFEKSVLGICDVTERRYIRLTEATPEGTR